MLGSFGGVLWAVLAGGLVYGELQSTVALRLSAEQEHDGVDLSIHRAGSTPERESIW